MSKKNTAAKVPTVPARKVLAQIEVAEVKKLQEIQRLLADAQLSYELMFVGAKAHNKALQEKYGLPEQFEIDTNNGNVYESTPEPVKGA
jgi:hypothetical protein